METSKSPLVAILVLRDVGLLLTIPLTRIVAVLWSETITRKRTPSMHYSSGFIPETLANLPFVCGNVAA